MSQQLREEHEQRDAALIAQSFLKQYPRCFSLLGGDVVSLMVEGYLFRRVIGALDAGQALAKFDANVLRKLRADVFNAANHLSAEHRAPNCRCVACLSLATTGQSSNGSP